MYPRSSGGVVEDVGFAAPLTAGATPATTADVMNWRRCMLLGPRCVDG
jgi:hypothetical protein